MTSKPTNHIMLDLETMGTGPDAAIIAIGAVAFTESGITDEFYGRVSLDSSVACGLTIDAKTVLWWLKQGDEARAEFAENSQDPNLGVQLVNFFNFAADSGATELWGCGSGFDNTIIRTAFKKTGLPLPRSLTYTADRCYRTMKAQFPEVEFEREGTHHHALDDARSQARHLIKIWEHLKMSTDQTPNASATWLPIDSAPKDGTTILLLVKCEHSPLEDEYPSMTIGSYTDSSEGEHWSFPGWSWEQDCFVEGEGELIGWMPLPTSREVSTTGAPN